MTNALFTFQRRKITNDALDLVNRLVWFVWVHDLKPRTIVG